MSKALIQMEVAARTGGDALRDFAMVSGMSEKQFVELWEKDPIQVFQRFIEGLGKLDDEGASAIATLNDIGISEIRLRDTLLRATNASELFSRAQDMANAAWEENTALTTMSEKKYATLASRLTNLKNRATLFAQTLGNDMRPAIEGVMDKVSGYIDRLEGMDQGQRLSLVQNAAIAASVGPVLFVFGNLAKLLGKVTGALGTFCTAVGAAGGGFTGLISVLSSSPVAILALTAALAVAIGKLAEWVSGARAANQAQKELNDTVEKWKENVLRKGKGPGCLWPRQGRLQNGCCEEGCTGRQGLAGPDDTHLDGRKARDR